MGISFGKNIDAIEAGTHQSLLAEKGHYYDLVNAQLFNRPKKEASPKAGTFPTKDQIYSTQVSVENVKMRRASIKETEKPTFFFWDLYNLLDRKTKGIFILAIFFGLTEGIVPPIYGLIFAQQEMGLVDLDPERMRAKGHAAAWNWIYLCCFEGFRIVPMAICFSIASCRLAEKIRAKIFENVLNQNGKFHDAAENSSGKLTALLASDAVAVRLAFGEPLGELCKGSVAAILGLFIGFYLNWPTTLLMLIIVPMASFHGITLRKLLLTYHREESSMNVNSSELLSEALANIKTVQCLNLQKPLLETYCEKLEKRVQTGQKRAKIRAFINAVNAMMNAWINSLKQGFASWLSAWDSTFDPISVMRTQFSLTNVVVDLKSATGYIDTHSKAQVSLENIGRLLELKPEIDNELDQNLNWGKIEFKNVSFTYPEQPEELVLKNVSFTIESGEKIGVVGRSGSGKSTIVALLQRIYSTKNGSVLIDGTKISKVPLHYLRSQIAVVSQEPTLFDDTIFNNIGYGLNLELLSMKSVIEVAKVAGIHEFITTLPDGYETKVGALGSQLSGGQKQRIAIARALVRKPKILIFDEATSALDSETEKSVQASIDLAAHGTTCITIAHRLASIKNCDRILVFEKGKLVEEGNHDTLLNTQGIYARLATLNDHNL
ncbi:unnamed protein product, partial [Mesorhabditis belari]|uniref:Uncharacterized protein n=1 Tax=Mesorhabditis belari TaxID=2138241 RepID=A0AAF3F326_9BILA